MEASRNTSVVILNRQAYRENDSLVVVYARELGKLNLLARGTQKLQSKLAGHIEPLTLADILIIPGQGFDYIASAVTRRAFFGIRRDLNKLYYSGRVLNIFNRLIRPGEPDDRLFFGLVGWLELLEDFQDQADLAGEFSREQGELFLATFIFKFLAVLGYQPELQRCLVCAREINPGNNYFDLRSGGLVHQDCAAEEQAPGQLVDKCLLTISSNCVKILRFLLENDLEKINKLRLDKKLIKELSVLANNFLDFYS